MLADGREGREKVLNVVRQLLDQGIAIVGHIADQPLGLGIDKTCGESLFTKGDLMWCSRLNVDGERETGSD